MSGAMLGQMSAGGDATGSALALALWSWALNVFAPAMALKKVGLYRPVELGKKPTARPRAGGGRSLSRRLRSPRFLRGKPAAYDTVEAFDACSSGYEDVVRPFSDPIFREALELVRPYWGVRPRLLDPSCGPGGMAIELAKLFPEGEVVAADLSRGMVEEAHRRATAQSLANMAFFQADVTQPPREFRGYFDGIFCCLSFHHYPDGAAAISAMREVLAPGGVVCIADPGPDWFIALSRGIAVATDPGFVRHRNGEEFRRLFADAGFSSTWWTEALPGVGITVAVR